MCTVSFVGDTWRERIPNDYPWTVPSPNSNPIVWPPAAPSQEEFDQLKRDVEEMRKELVVARQQDIEDGNPDCEMEEKIAFIRGIAEFVGIDLDEVFGGK